MGRGALAGPALVLAGFSFGGYVALRLALRRGAARLITVAPADQRFDDAGMRLRMPLAGRSGRRGRCRGSAGRHRLGDGR